MDAPLKEGGVSPNPPDVVRSGESPNSLNQFVRISTLEDHSCARDAFSKERQTLFLLYWYRESTAYESEEIGETFDS
jgi:hypothetical protein